MSTEKKEKKVVKGNTYESLKALYYSGKVKPSLNKIITELKTDSDNLELSLLACQGFLRTKDYNGLSSCADTVIKLAPENGAGHHFKGEAFHHMKGKEQDAIKKFNEALALDPDNPVYLLSKATTHLLLFKDYHLPIKFADKHRLKSEESLNRIVELVEQKENPDAVDYLAIADASIMLTQNMDAKKYYIKAVRAFDAIEESEQNMNIYKDIIKAQKACVRIMKSAEL